MSTPQSPRNSSTADDASPSWAQRWHDLAEEVPPQALESRLMAAFDARASHRRSRSRPWALGLALAASLAVAAVIGTRLQWQDDTSALVDHTAERSLPEAAFSGDGETLRSIDRALLQARMDASTYDGNDAYEDSLWQARRRVLTHPNSRDGSPYEADIDPLMI